MSIRDTWPSLRPPRPYPARTALCVLLAAALLACTGGGEDSASDDRVLELEARARSLEESVQALADENADLKSEIAVLRQAQAELVEAQEAAEAAGKHEDEVADFEEGQEERLAALEESQVHTDERLDDMDARLRELEEVASIVEPLLPIVEQWTTGKGLSQPESSVLESTVEAGGGLRGPGPLRRPPPTKGPLGYDHPLGVRRRRDPAHRFPSRLRGELRRPRRLRAPSPAGEQGRVRPAAAQRDPRRPGQPLLEPHGPLLRVRQDRRGRRGLSDGTGGGGAEGQGVRAGVLLRLLQRRVHVIPHGVQGPARPPRRGQPGRYELRRGLKLRRLTPRVRVARPRDLRQCDLVRGRPERARPQGRRQPGVLRRGRGDGGAVEPAGRLRLARTPPALCHPGPGPVRAGPRDPGIPRGRRAAPGESTSSCGWARAAATRPATATPSWTP